MEENKKHQTIFDINYLVIFKIILVLLLFWFLYLVRDIILILFIALIVSSAIIPWVDKWEKRKIPRIITLLFIFIVFFGSIGFVIYLTIPVIQSQLHQLMINFPYYYNKFFSLFGTSNRVISQNRLNFQEIIYQWNNNLIGRGKTLFSTLGSFLGGLAGLVIALVITFYITLEKDSVKKFLRAITPIKYQPYIIQLYQRIEKKMGHWLRGQLFLCFIVGLLCFIGLEILGIRYALILGVIAGVTELIPYLGPWLGAIPAILLAFIQEPIKAFWVALLYLIVQQVENHIIVPSVMKKAVGLNPIVTIIAIAIGGKLGGVAGAILAVPLAAVISIVAKDVYSLRQEKERKKI